MNQPVINDPRARLWGNVVKIAAVLIGGFIIAPYVWVAVGGLIGLGLGVAIIVLTWMLRHWFFAVAANLRLKLIKAEAARNPVETLQEEYRKEMVRLDERKTAIESLKAHILQFEDKTAEMEAKYPNDPTVVKFKRDIATLNRIYENRCALWRKAREELSRFKEEIDRGDVIWKTAQAAAAAHEASGLSEEDFFSRLRKETAFDAIKLSYNQSIASLDSAMLEAPQMEVVELPPAHRPALEAAPKRR
jgi:hypothetical protein